MRAWIFGVMTGELLHKIVLQKEGCIHPVQTRVVTKFVTLIAWGQSNHRGVRELDLLVTFRATAHDRDGVSDIALGRDDEELTDRGRDARRMAETGWTENSTIGRLQFSWRVLFHALPQDFQVLNPLIVFGTVEAVHDI